MIFEARASQLGSSPLIQEKRAMPTRTSLCKVALGCAPFLVPIPAEVAMNPAVAVGLVSRRPWPTACPPKTCRAMASRALRIDDQWSSASARHAKFDTRNAKRLGIPLDPLPRRRAKAESWTLTARSALVLGAGASREWFWARRLASRYRRSTSRPTQGRHVRINKGGRPGIVALC